MAGRSAHVRRPISSFQSHEHNNNTSSSSSGSNHASTGPGTFTSQIPVPIMHMRTPDRRRSSSQGDATPRAPAHALAQADSPQPQTQTQASASEHPSKRLGFLGDILLSSAGSIATSASTQRASPIPHGLLPARTHSRGDSGYNRDNASSPIPPMASSAGQPAKGHTSPSKASSTRTYDAKLVSREMHRLGTLAHLPALAAPPTALALSLAAQMTAPPGIGGSSGGGAGGSAGSSVGHAVLSSAMSAESPWTSLHVLVLPLFNDEPLRVPIEDLNQLVKRHIQTVVSAAPGKAVATLEHDTYELIAAGMVTLNSKLAGVDDDKLVSRVVEVWSSFWTQVLPYLEGALLPLQTDQILSALYRLPKAHRPASPTATQNGKGASASAGLLLQSTTSPIDVRALALVSFRDRVVLPLFPRLYARLTMSKDENPASTEPHQARLQQMLLVLVSQRSHRLVSLSLTMPPPQPTAGEAALARLLRALHAPLTTRPARPTTGAPSFLSAGLPRDRRGRIAHRAERSHAHAHSHSYAPTQTQAHGGRVSGAELDARGRWRLREEAGEFEEGNDEDEDYDEGGGRGADGYWYEGETDTPRVGVSFADPVRERDKEFLESLRSPDPENSTRMSMGGWGLPGAGREGEGEDVYADVEEDEEDDEKEEEGEDEAMDWDAAQAVVERMVGMKAEPASAPTHQQLPPQLQPQPQPQPQQQTQAPLQQPDPRRRMI